MQLIALAHLLLFVYQHRRNSLNFLINVVSHFEKISYFYSLTSSQDLHPKEKMKSSSICEEVIILTEEEREAIEHQVKYLNTRRST